MRVVSGKYRGLNLAEFNAENIRPTADRVKESLFNILSSKVAGAQVLDLFRGSGNLGIECLSRGARQVFFNDISKQSLQVLNKNLSRLKGGEKYTVNNCDYLSFLNSTAEKFDIIFLDPPYAMEISGTALLKIAERDLLNDGGVVVYERDLPFSGETPLEVYDTRKYGRVHLTFFRKKGDAK